MRIQGSKQRRLRVPYNVALMIEDAAEKGWNQTNLARVTGRDKSTIALFMAGKVQTPKVAKQIADALGRPVKRYMLRGVPVDQERVA